jgi:hypothetical protein
VIALCIASAAMAYAAVGFSLHALVVANSRIAGREEEGLRLWSALWPIPVAVALVSLAVGFVRGFRRGVS